MIRRIVRFAPTTHTQITSAAALIHSVRTALVRHSPSGSTRRRDRDLAVEKLLSYFRPQLPARPAVSALDFQVSVVTRSISSPIRVSAIGRLEVIPSSTFRTWAFNASLPLNSRRFLDADIMGSGNLSRRINWRWCQAFDVPGVRTVYRYWRTVLLGTNHTDLPSWINFPIASHPRSSCSSITLQSLIHPSPSSPRVSRQYDA